MIFVSDKPGLECPASPLILCAAKLLCQWGFSRQEYWSGLPWPPPGDLPNPGTKLRSAALQANSLLSEPPEKHWSEPLCDLRQVLKSLWTPVPYVQKCCEELKMYIMGMGLVRIKMRIENKYWGRIPGLLMFVMKLKGKTCNKWTHLTRAFFL